MNDTCDIAPLPLPNAKNRVAVLNPVFFAKRTKVFPALTDNWTNGGCWALQERPDQSERHDCRLATTQLKES